MQRNVESSAIFFQAFNSVIRNFTGSCSQYFEALWQFPSKEEEQHTFRTTPREHCEFGRSAQDTPKLTIKKLRPARYRSTSCSVLLSDDSVFTHGFINTTLSTATFIF